MSARIRVGSIGELGPERVLHARMTPEQNGTPREALVLLDDAGVVRAYLNRCRHLPIPLDGGSRRFLDDEHRHLMCGTHGALFRREDGYCFVGPCRGDSLRALAVEIDASGEIWIDPG
ncbi:MAG: Rieske 2Fe-2S domain-containing protein [Myxococcota bacterium]|nr:Rieske 2Fe-2S domain-containing protein [Myxococcota bacterium]